MEDEKEKNMLYLKNDLKYLGFGEKLYGELEASVAEKPDKFKLLYSGEFITPDGKKEDVRYAIDFKKSETSERYFLNSYTATLKNETDPTQEKSQLFYINKGSGITAKEAYNLLNGRAVEKQLTTKEDQKFRAWVQLDFDNREPNGNFKTKQFHENYGFNLPETLANYPLKNFSDPDETVKLLRGLERGNVQPAVFVKGGMEEKVFLVANPQFKNLKVFDADMKHKTMGIERKEQQPDQKKEKKEAVKNDDDDSSKDTKRKRRGIGM